ncbi:nucleotidyltransferase family protein [Methanospirillum hungatei]|uniref:nucleotidyltransferase family protein n=1 Tax=Methanospirillum hungatei TaxID=2203 RepID=UPI0026EC03D0|nr:nucleotidyltransferase family protein [Methanospirillum hungatei]MCA1915705.1 nucleotidyltransferase family protein [Methanospirillum hungatei]
MKKKEEVISVLKEKRPDIIQKYHITRIGIFGSVIRGEAGPGSNIDILVDFSDDASLLNHSGLKIYLEKIFGQPVDVVPERAIRAELKTPILSEVVYI